MPQSASWRRRGLGGRRGFRRHRRGNGRGQGHAGCRGCVGLGRRLRGGRSWSLRPAHRSLPRRLHWRAAAAAAPASGSILACADAATAAAPVADARRRDGGGCDRKRRRRIAGCRRSSGSGRRRRSGGNRHRRPASGVVAAAPSCAAAAAVSAAESLPQAASEAWLRVRFRGLVLRGRRASALARGAASASTSASASPARCLALASRSSESFRRRPVGSRGVARLAGCRLPLRGIVGAASARRDCCVGARVIVVGGRIAVDQRRETVVSGDWSDLAGPRRRRLKRHGCCWI